MLSRKRNMPLLVYQLISLILLVIMLHYIMVSADTKKSSERRGTAQTNTTKSISSTGKNHTEYEDPFKIGLNPKRDYLILVNKDHQFEFNGEYDKSLKKDLIYVSNVHGDPIQIEKGAYLAFSLFRKYLNESEGVDVDLYDCYHSKKEQEWYSEQNTGFGSDSTNNNPIDMPGYSERHTGLLLQIKVRQPLGETGKEVWTTELFEPQSDNPYFQKVHENLAKYGFIMRYPDHKEAITGSPYRPYEIRFVGSSEVARSITNNQLCLEEYLANIEKYNK